MRIVEVISGLGLGGTERALAKRLLAAPPEVETHVIVTSREDSYLRSEIEQNATVYRGSGNVTGRLHALNPDLVLTHNPREAMRVLSHPTLPRRFPVVVVAHNEITSEYKLKAKFLDTALPHVNQRAQMHIAVSTRAAMGPQCRNAVDVRVCLLGGSIDPPGAEPCLGWPSTTTHRILVLGRLSPQKNLRSLVAAVQMVRERMELSNTHVLVAGDGELHGPLAKEVEKRKIAHLITFSGWVDHSTDLMRSAQTLLITSTNEGGPITLFEGLLTGVQVISTPVGAARDVLIHDSRSHILTDSSPSSIATGLLAASETHDLPYEQRMKRGREFNWLNSSARAREFYTLCMSAAQVCI